MATFKVSGTHGNPSEVTSEDPIFNKLGKTNKYPKKHPMNNTKNNDKLVGYIKARVEHSNILRDLLVQQMREIDYQLSGFVALDKEDKKRDADNKQGKNTKPVKQNLQYVNTKIRDMSGFLLDVFAPDENIYEAVGPSDVQSNAKGLSLMMSRQGIHDNYRTKMNNSFTDILKYNLGGWVVEWVQERGVKFSTTVDGRPEFQENQVVWQGNSMIPLDMYNFLWDTSVHPLELHRKGEWFAMVEMVNRFSLRRKEASGELFDVDKYIQETGPQDSLYNHRPHVRNRDHAYNGESNSPDWDSIYGGGPKQIKPEYELTTLYMRLIPKDFGLGDEETLKIFKIKVVNMRKIVFAEELKQTHGMLPCAISQPTFDEKVIESKSRGEELLPYQHLMSFAYNTYQDAVRKSIYGVTFYDANTIPFDDMDRDDIVTGLIPVKRALNSNEGISKYIHSENDTSGAGELLNTIEAMDALSEKTLPTERLKGIVDMDRAVTDQVGAAIHSAEAPTVHIAKLISSQCMAPARMQMVFNILAFEEELSVRNSDGTMVDIDPSTLEADDFLYIIGEGLRSLEKKQSVAKLYDAFGRLIQIPDVTTRVDVVGMLNHITSLEGDHTDLSQFNLTAQQRVEDGAVQGASEGASGAVNAALNPEPQQAITSPGGVPPQGNLV